LSAGRGRFGFGPERRLKKRGDYLRVQAQGFRISVPSFIILVCARSDDAPGRLGITVTRKFGNSVARNRARRLVREAFRLSPLSAPEGIDLVVIPKRSAALPGLAEVLGELNAAAPNLTRQAARLRAELAKAGTRTQTAASPRRK
jgi:ribonuclease P protein component